MAACGRPRGAYASPLGLPPPSGLPLASGFPFSSGFPSPLGLSAIPLTTIATKFNKSRMAYVKCDAVKLSVDGTLGPVSPVKSVLPGAVITKTFLVAKTF
jgi:hypothetical protein